jgi:bifunctional enzyme CysN/CysC
MSIIKILTCGSVDDGKSTLIGRIMYETNNLFIDQSDYLTKMLDNNNDDIDFSLLLDGLLDEKEQKITIDAAFKYLTVDEKNFVFIDSPGHSQYTKNMAYASTFANIAILLIDAKKGISEQTKIHLNILKHLDSVKKIIVCINKIDLVNYDENIYNTIKDDLNLYSKSLDLKINSYIPISAKLGDNIFQKSNKLKFYNGPTLLSDLNSYKLEDAKQSRNTLLSIQFQTKIKNQRMYAAYQELGSLKEKDELINLTTGEKVNIKSIYFNLEKRKSTFKNSNIFFTTSKETSINKGDIFVKKTKELNFTNSFKGKVVWLSKNKPLKSSNYIIKFKYQENYAFLTNLRNLNKSSMIFEVNIELSKKIAISEKINLSSLRNFIIIDQITYETVGMGVVSNNLDKGSFLFPTSLNKFQKKSTETIWFTGLSGSGKTTIANELGKLLSEKKVPYYILDGDNLRNTINKDLGFSETDRVENNRRIAHVASILSDAGIVPIVSTISPLERIRLDARKILGKNNFSLIYLNADLKTCIKRSKKNLYRNKHKHVKNITGQDQIFEKPQNPDLIIDVLKNNAKKSANIIFESIFDNEY